MNGFLFWHVFPLLLITNLFASHLDYLSTILALKHKSSKNHWNSSSIALECSNILKAMMGDLEKLEKLFKWVLFFYLNLWFKCMALVGIQCACNGGVACFLGSLMCFVLECKDVVMHWILKSCLFAQKIICTTKP